MAEPQLDEPVVTQEPTPVQGPSVTQEPTSTTSGGEPSSEPGPASRGKPTAPTAGTNESAAQNGSERRPVLAPQKSIPVEHFEDRWMHVEPSDSCPPGLEYLMSLDKVFVHQHLELLEALSGWETANKYVVKNEKGLQMYFAAETSNCCERQWCGPSRSFKMSILDHHGKELMCMQRPYRCGYCCCCDGCRPSIEVQAPPDTTIGYVKSDGCAGMWPKLLVMDANMEPALRIHTPRCGYGFTCTPQYTVRSLDDQEVGKIEKKWSGLTKELFSDFDNFGISFPADLDVKMKATLLGALFLTDFLFFERNQFD